MRRFTPSRLALGWLVTGLVCGVLFEYVARHERMWVYIAPQAIIEQRSAVAGSGDFSGTSEIETGLGPVFNARSCSACHNIPAKGGTGFRTIIKVGHRAADGSFRALGRGTLLPASSIESGACDPQLPDDANVIARRIPTPLFGLGLIDQLADDDIAAAADPHDRDGDGVRGRAALVVDPATGTRRVGRFGWKAEDASLLVSVARAYAGEAGVTNRVFPLETSLGLSPEELKTCDHYNDPEDEPDAATGLAATDRLTAFVRSLPPPPRAPAGQTEAHGERLFTSVGCATCHRPALQTPSGELVHAFSDFLLHDIGTGDGIAEGDANTAEMRTAPLWGVGKRPLLLHDGSAVTLEEAIEVHGGEAANARGAFLALDAAPRAALLAFLKSL